MSRTNTYITIGCQQLRISHNSEELGEGEIKVFAGKEDITDLFLHYQNFQDDVIEKVQIEIEHEKFENK